jgi:hypothetical protein
MISLNQHVSPVEAIEGDAFISTAFVDQIFLGNNNNDNKNNNYNNNDLIVIYFRWNTS